MAKLTLWLHHIAKLYDKAMSVRSIVDEGYHTHGDTGPECPFGGCSIESRIKLNFMYIGGIKFRGSVFTHKIRENKTQ